jgi:hypothetical protein
LITLIKYWGNKITWLTYRPGKHALPRVLPTRKMGKLKDRMLFSF